MHVFSAAFLSHFHVHTVGPDVAVHTIFLKILYVFVCADFILIYQSLKISLLDTIAVLIVCVS